MHADHDDDEPGGPLMMTRYRGAMAVVAVILVVGLLALSLVWVLAWG